MGTNLNIQATLCLFSSRNMTSAVKCAIMEAMDREQDIIAVEHYREEEWLQKQGVEREKADSKMHNNQRHDDQPHWEGSAAVHPSDRGNPGR